jgi:hypothetical protein
MPNQVSGEFPRDDDPNCRDSAIYLVRTSGKDRQTVRIAIKGTAIER